MTVTGLESDLYYINNPILIDIKALDPNLNYIDLQVTNINDTGAHILSNVLRVYPNLDNEIIDFDLSEVLKANFTKPEHPTATLPNDTVIQTNYIRFSLTMQQRLKDNLGDGTPFAVSKTYLRGGEDSQETNVNTSIATVLKDTDKLLLWGALPISKYYIDANKKIAVTNNIPETEIEKMNAIGCDPFYVRFLNSKGGYSFWYFPVWEQNKKTKSEDWVKRSRPINSFSLGYTATHTVKAESRIRREHFGIAESLIDSPEVYVYNRYGYTWSKIEVNDSTFSQNTYEDVQDFNIDFNLHLTNDGRLIW